MTEQELASLLGRHASAHRVPGAAVGILVDGMQTIACHGVANAKTLAPVIPESRFGVGSLTKSMVATVIARLAARSRLSLDDPIAAHVPELAGAAWAQRADVRDLLANRSGLPLRLELEAGFADYERDGEDVLAEFVAHVASAEPTSIAWSYTNAGWCVLGRAVETLTGRRWEEAMRAELFDLAGMRETSYATESACGHRVTGHEPAPDGPIPVPPLVSRAFGPAGTSVDSTVGDLLRFAALQLEDPALATLRLPQSSPRIHGWLDGWGLGLARFEWNTARAWGWDSVLPGERAFLRLLPEHSAALVLVTNSESGRALCRSLLPELVGELFEIEVPPLPLDAHPGAAGELSRFAGTYAWPDRRVVVSATRTALILEEDGAEREALPIDGETFLVDPEDPDVPTLSFAEFDAAGRPHAVYLMLWGLPRIDD